MLALFALDELTSVRHAAALWMDRRHDHAKKKKDSFNFTPATETRLRGLGSMQSGYLARAVTFLPPRIAKERTQEGPHEAPAA